MPMKLNSLTRIILTNKQVWSSFSSASHQLLPPGDMFAWLPFASSQSITYLIGFCGGRDVSLREDNLTVEKFCGIFQFSKRDTTLRYARNLTYVEVDQGMSSNEPQFVF